MCESVTQTAAGVVLPVLFSSVELENILIGKGFKCPEIYLRSTTYEHTVFVYLFCEMLNL